MIAFNAITAITWTWEGLAALWLAGYAFTKPAVRKAPLGSRVFNSATVLLGFALMGIQWFARGWLAVRFVPPSGNLRLAGFLLTLAGVLFACWARLTLGTNWSGRPSVKAGHELIVKGPYALARHPIYTGLLLAVAGTALAVGQLRAILGFLLVLLAFAAKIRQEERFMQETFPDAYPPYRRRVKALIPGLL
jgi:protein-S-isoprenylcysteine O-methyltransferase Ste14